MHVSLLSLHAELPTQAKDAGAMQKFMDDVVTMQGLDAKAVGECIASGRQRNGISRDIEQGRELQLTGTPSIYINGKLVKNPTVGSIQRILQTLSAQSYAQ
jgi:protein-disulfide isomerase